MKLLLIFSVLLCNAAFSQDFNNLAEDGTEQFPRQKSAPPPPIKLNVPSTENFFRKGKRVFPASFQLSSELPTREERGDSVDISSSEYPVGPGDQFLINFWGQIEDNILVSINSQGQLFIPRIGVIDTKGLLFEEFEARVSKKILSHMKGVQFTVALYKARQFSVYVLGAVGAPGPVLAQANMRASEVLKLANGLNATATRQYIELRRANSEEPLRIDLLRYLSFADFSLNPFVTENDVIFVPNLDDFVTVTGAVLEPGTFEIRDTKKLTEVIEKLGGRSVYADLSAPIRLSRLQADGSRRQLRIAQSSSAVESEDQLVMDEVMLQTGDEIYVPSAQLLIPSRSNMIFVTGEVKQPGGIPHSPSMSAEEYIGMAGGLTPRANLAGAVIYKADGSSVKLQQRTPIDPGDTLFLPEKTFKFWQDHLAIATTFISLATSIIVLSSR